MLNGVRVVEIGQALSAPFASETLGFLGAEVIKVERPSGDDTRVWGEQYRNGSSVIFHMVNKNKKSVVLDLTQFADKKRLLAVISSADVFLHNMRPGSAEKMGLGAEALRQKFPKLIYGELGAFGNKGPLRNEAGYEMLMQAFSGIMSITGEPNGLPVRAGPSICDLGAGMWLALGILAALLKRQQTGKGCTISTSIFETALFWSLLPSADYVGHGRLPERAGNGHPAITPYGLFETSDGSLILGAGNDRLFAKLAKALDREDLAADPRFKENQSRLKHRRVIEGLVAEKLLGDTTDHWVSVLATAGVPCSPLQTVPEAIEHPQTTALGILQQSEGAPDLRIIGLPISFDGERPALRTSAPALGADNKAVLGSDV